jgi:hypothetical protein
LCACSLSEMTYALELAWRHDWRYFTILLHSFELIRDRTARSSVARPDSINIRRFEGLCEFLAVNRARFRTQIYRDVDLQDVGNCAEATPITTGIWRTASRVAQQAWSRIR